MFRKVSTDGITWSKFEIMYTFNASKLQLSPSVIYDSSADKYKYWGIESDSGKLFYMAYSNGKWSEQKETTIPNSANTLMWHGSVSYIDKEYHFVFVGKDSTDDFIYHCKSKDGLTFSEPKMIISNTVGWEKLYRPCLIKSNGIYHCFYGVVTKDNRWYITENYGTSSDDLHPITPNELVSKGIQSTYTPKYQDSFIKRFSDCLLSFFKPYLLVGVIFSIVLIYILNKKNIKLWSLIVLISNIVLDIILFSIVSHSFYINSLYIGIENGIISTGLASIIFIIIRQFKNLKEKK